MSFYLQITTKCNMFCNHCCYSCGKWGKHGDYETIKDAIDFAAREDNCTISIGGGEPTLHPHFFDILKRCLSEFDYLCLATNGSQTKIMHRLGNIIDGCDYESFDDVCKCKTEKERDYCSCYDKIGYIDGTDKLSVALSQDSFHDPINESVRNRWIRNANMHKRSGYEIRNVTASHNGVAAAGRAKKTNSGWSDHCVCSTPMIKPDGRIKLCGCIGSPVIGDIYRGIDNKWAYIMQNDEKYQSTECYKSVSKKFKEK